MKTKISLRSPKSIIYYWRGLGISSFNEHHHKFLILCLSINILYCLVPSVKTVSFYNLENNSDQTTNVYSIFFSVAEQDNQHTITRGKWNVTNRSIIFCDLDEINNIQTANSVHKFYISGFSYSKRMENSSFRDVFFLLFFVCLICIFSSLILQILDFCERNDNKKVCTNLPNILFNFINYFFKYLIDLLWIPRPDVKRIPM